MEGKKEERRWFQPPNSSTTELAHTNTAQTVPGTVLDVKVIYTYVVIDGQAQCRCKRRSIKHRMHFFIKDEITFQHKSKLRLIKSKKCYNVLFPEQMSKHDH